MSIAAQRPWLAGPEPAGPMHILLSFDGRVGRKTWWLYGVLAMLGLSALFTSLLRIAGLTAAGADLAVNVLLLWPVIAVSAKRWHDRGKSAWWVLIWLIPVIGWLWVVIENGFLRGTPGPNAYGAPEITD